MKKYSILFTIISVLCFFSCHHNIHHDHDHECEADHDHEHELLDDDHGHDHDHEHEAVGGHVHDEDGAIHLSPKQAQQVGVVVDTVKLSSFYSVIHAGGRLGAANNDEYYITAKVSGTISTLTDKSMGASIKQSELIASIAPAVEGKSSYEEAKQTLQKATTEYYRAAELYKEQVISQKQYEEAKYQYQQASTAFAPYKEMMVEGGKDVKIRSQKGGYLKNIMVRPNEYVNAGQTLAVVANSNRLQLTADVPECGYRQLHTIRSANFTTTSGDETYSLSELNGKLLSYGKSSSGSSFVPVTFEFDNRGNFLSDSYVEVYLLGDEDPNVISVPKEAITEEQGLYFVYVKECEEEYRKVPVKLGENDGIRVRITDGLKVGDVLVVKGAYQVKLASMSSSIPEGHSHNH